MLVLEQAKIEKRFGELKLIFRHFVKDIVNFIAFTKLKKL